MAVELGALSVMETGRCQMRQPPEAEEDDQEEPIQTRAVRDHGAFEVPAAPLEILEGRFNGLITNDKFCLSRHVRLKLTWSRYPLRLRLCARASGAYLPGESAHVGTHRGGSYETTMAHPSPDTPPVGRATTLGPRLPTPFGVDDAK
jgi:hypothetical protein